MDQINIAPFALPNCDPGEIRFEEPRDIVSVVVTFKGVSPKDVGLSYLRKNWPDVRLEEKNDIAKPAFFGWVSMDDQFNGEWQKAAAVKKEDGKRNVELSFNGLSEEGIIQSEGDPDQVEEVPDRSEEESTYKRYDVRFRRTMGIRVDCEDVDSIEKIQVFTKSQVRRSGLHVQLDKGKQTPGKSLRIEGYNALIEGIEPVGIVAAEGRAVQTSHDDQGNTFELSIADDREFTIAVRHMQPWYKYARDDGHVRLILDEDSFTVSLTSLEKEGPIWFEEYGFYINLADDHTTFESYRAACRGSKTTTQRVMDQREQSYAGSIQGQPRPHPVAYTLGCKHERQRFWQDPNGDILLTKKNVHWVPGRDTKRFANSGTGRLFFGLEEWGTLGRFSDPAPVLAYNLLFRRGTIELAHKSFAVLLERPMMKDESGEDKPGGGGPMGGSTEGNLKGVKPRGDDSVICLVRLRFSNRGAAVARAELTVSYSQDSRRSPNMYFVDRTEVDNWMVPQSEREHLTLENTMVTGKWKGKPVPRFRVDTEMAVNSEDGGIHVFRDLEPGEECEAVFKIPYIRLESQAELMALENLDFDESYREMAAFWRQESARGARVTTPVEQINSLHLAHLAHVQVTDFAMPEDPALINTSVGSSTYGNFSNESCMIVRDLMERGLFEEVRRRLDVWVKYQGSVPLAGNFTDHDGLFFGAGGFEMGQYNQHHGWVLWAICEYYIFTGDRGWFESNVEAAIAGADWVLRQRKNTMTTLPHSRGWEYGFLPAGSLEDVTDFHYWLSTNVLTWRGCVSCARTLEELGHSDAVRIREETDAYGRDLVKGFETMRQYSPLVRLRNGRWVPHYSSRIYCRGRDLGWIRELLEGSIYLIISELYGSMGQKAEWILNDYQDNLYLCPPYGYPVVDEESEWFDRGGISIQPNLLAGLIPYLDRDEPELYIWMFFNAWASCYREEIGAMVEHPLPVLGYSNWAHFKTSDQANTMMWLRYMFVYSKGGTLHLGRAIPRAWFRRDRPIEAMDVETVFGRVSVSYRTEPSAKQPESGAGKFDSGVNKSASDTAKIKPSAHKITADVALQLRKTPERISVRFRHPEKRKITSVEVNGRRWKEFDTARSDVDITGQEGHLSIAAFFEA